MATYFSHVLRVSIYNHREWYVEEFKFGNPLHSVHRMLKLIFETKEECEGVIYEKIKKEGGTFIEKPPVQGRRLKHWD